MPDTAASLSSMLLDWRSLPGIVTMGAMRDVSGLGERHRRFGQMYFDAEEHGPCDMERLAHLHARP